MRVQPGLQLLGILGDHDGFPIEGLASNANFTLIASISHDTVVRFWDARELRAARNDDVVDMECEKSQTLRAGGESDDDQESAWETDDESNSVAAGVKRGSSRTIPAHSRKRRPTETFFGGL